MPEDEEVYTVTEEARLWMIMQNFGIDVNFTVAKAVWREFTEQMVEAGRMVREEQE